MSDRPDHTGSVVIQGTVTITGDVTITGPVTVTGTVSISGTVTVAGTVSISGTVTVTGAVTVSGTVSISGTVTVTGTVAISGTVTVTGSVTVSGTVSISGTVTVSGTVSISGTVTVSGSVTITSGTVSISGTVNITGPVTVSSGNINVATAGGTNIIIDKLTQDATYGKARELAYDGVTTTPSGYVALNLPRAKIFARGAIGMIYRLQAWIKNVSGSAQTLTFHLCNQVGGARLYTGSASVPDATDGLIDLIYAYTTALKSFWWTYDKLIVEFAANDNLSIAYGVYASDDGFVYYSGAWYAEYNPVVRCRVTGQDVGDLPVSGTLNTIAVPNTVGAISHPANNSINGGTTYELLATIYGAGELCGLNVYTQQNAGSTVTDAAQIIGIVVDGTTYEIKASDVVSVSRSNVVGSAAPFILTHITAASNIYAWAITQKIPFQRSLRIYARNNAASGQYMTAEVMFIYTLLR